MQIAATTPSLHRWMIACLFATVIVRVVGAHDVELPTAGGLQVAVLPDGFAVIAGAPSDRHLGALDRDGHPMYHRAVPVSAAEARVVGTAQGPAIGWVENRKVELARVSGDGELSNRTSWGKRVKQMCYGAASNEHNFGIGWLENDGRVWVVWGPTSSSASAWTVPADVEMTSTAWCAVASAGTKLALVWADQHNRIVLNLCGKKGCEQTLTRLPLTKKQSLERLACSETACLLLYRDERSALQLGWMTTKGKLTWSRPIADAADGTGFSLTAAGDRAFVVGYVTREGATATRVIEGGSMVRAWADPSSWNDPVVTWANDRLLVARSDGDRQVRTDVVALPR